MIRTRSLSLPRWSLRMPALLALFAAGGLHALRAQQFSEIVIFGDSLSDVGNIADRTDDTLDLRYPGSDFNYTNGRFTDGRDTDPTARKVFGVWHEQLAKAYLNVAQATASQDGGLDYAFGGAKTIDGTTTKDLASDPVFDQKITIDIDNMGKQVGDYLNAHVPKPDGLFAVWGGGNDLFDNPDSPTVTQTASNVYAIIVRLAHAGARFFIVPNVPPLGLVPTYNKDATKSAQLNQASSDYRTLLGTTLDNVEAQLVSEGTPVTIYRLDIYQAFMNFLDKPEAYGFENISDSSQGTSGNPNKYLFWDGIHPTTVGHAYIAAEAYSVISGKPVVIAATVTNQLPEGPASQAQFYLTRFGEDFSKRLKVPFTLSGTDASGNDFAAAPVGLRKIHINQRYQLVKVNIIDDTVHEDNETLTLSVTATDDFTRAGKLGLATVTITDNDN